MPICAGKPLEMLEMLVNSLSCQVSPQAIRKNKVFFVFPCFTHLQSGL